MSDKLMKIKLKGNESFNIREGWLRKGMRCVSIYEDLFSREDAMEILGVGSKMVKSIRFWLQASGLTKENVCIGRSRTQFITKEFGRIIEKYDSYFEDIFTLWLIHYKIVKNEELCIAWHVFFNEFDSLDFRKEDVFETLKISIEKKLVKGAGFSEKSLEDDCNSIIKMYFTAKDSDDPEENLGSPLAELGLVQKSNKEKNGYNKMIPYVDKLDKFAVLYVIVDNLENGKISVSVEDLLTKKNNIGKTFNLNRMLINEYLDKLRICGFLTINRTAGLDMIYIENLLSPQEIMIKYYEQ